MLRLCFLLTFLLAACERPIPRPTPAAIDVTPAAFRFPRTFAGFSRSATLLLSNHGRPWMPLHAEVSAPFSVAIGAPLEDPRAVVLVLATPTAGGIDGELTVDDGNSKATIHLQADVEPAPDCGATTECLRVGFDPDTGECARDLVPDGTPCLAACSATNRCRAGECEGIASACDDGDRCTVDSCDPREGCRHVPVVCNTDRNHCFEQRCNPDDGLCEPRGTGAASNSCDWRPPQPLAPAWSYSPTESGTIFFFDGILDLAGRPYATECNRRAPFGCRLLSFDADGRVRFSAPVPTAVTTQWTGANVAIIGEVALVTHDGGQALAAFRTSDGAMLWDKPVPELVARLSPALQPVVGRIVALGGADMAVEMAGNRDELLGFAFLDAASGTMRTWLGGSGAHWQRAIGDGKGTLFIQAEWNDDGRPMTRVDAIDAAGGTLWSTDEGGSDEADPAPPSADLVVDGVVLGYDGTVLDAATGQIVLRGREEVPRDPATTLAGAGNAFTRGTFTDGLCSGVRFLRFSPTTAATQASCDFVTGIPLRALLTETGSALFLPSAGSNGSLVEVSADAQSLFAAQLTAGGVTQLAALAPGRLYLAGTGATALLAYDLSGKAPAAHGWITTNGNQQGTWSALP